MFASVNYCLNLANGIGNVDDIDHLGNRRVRCVGELLQNQFRIGLARMERTVRERMSTQELEIITPTSLINIRPIIATITLLPNFVIREEFQHLVRVVFQEKEPDLKFVIFTILTTAECVLSKLLKVLTSV